MEVDAYQEIARIVGIENAIKLSEHLGGLAFYPVKKAPSFLRGLFPKIDTVIQKKRDENIRREFTGANHKDLAKKYGLSEIWIRQIVENGKDERQERLL